MGSGTVAGWAAVAVLVLAGCGAESGVAEELASDPTPAQSLSPTEVALGGLLLAEEVSPAPPSTIMDTSGPVALTGLIGEPSRQFMTCSPLSVPDSDGAGPAEPEAAGAASSSSLLGIAQLDQYAIAYVDDAAAERAVDRARVSAENCAESFAVHSPDTHAEAAISGAPDGVDGFRVHATYSAGDAGTGSDEASAVLRSGPTVLYLRANETGAGPNSDVEVDGTLDADWVDRMVEAAAAHLAES